MAAGHTATDQVETILYRLASSPSRRALLGMRPREGVLVRPLLGHTREQTAAYCTDRGLSWREDESNDVGRLRPQPDPGRAAAGAARRAPRRPATTCSPLADVLRDEAAVLDGLVDDVLARAATRSSWRACASCRRRCRGWSCSAWPTRLPAGSPRARAARLGDVTALSDRGHGRAATSAPACARSPSTGWCGSSGSTQRPGATGRRGPVRLPIPGAVRFGPSEVSCELGPPAREPGDARPRHARRRARGPLLAPGRPDGAARARREQEPAGPVHRPAGPEAASAARSPWSSPAARSPGWPASPPPSASRSRRTTREGVRLSARPVEAPRV